MELIKVEEEWLKHTNTTIFLHLGERMYSETLDRERSLRILGGGGG